MADRRRTDVAGVRTLTAAVALVVTACGGVGSPAPSPPPSGAAPSAPPASAAPVSPSPGGSSGPIPPLSAGGAEDLVALLPAEVNGVTLLRGGYDFGNWPDLLPIDIDETEVDTFLKDHGKSLRDVRFAIGYAIGTTGAPYVTAVEALQVEGIDPEAFRAWAVEQFASGAEQHTVAGKQVYGWRGPGVAPWLYVKGDIAFLVLGPNEQIVEEILAALP